MTYFEVVQKLQSINLSGGTKLGLHNSLQLQKLLNFPDRTFTSIHVAGTNGKGSVSLKIATALKLAGYKTGLYTSPHISCFRERIRINGEMISEEDVEKLLHHLFSISHDRGIPATFFELTTFLAFSYFAEQHVDFAVIETGLGGRLDATNVIFPVLSIITTIGMDHMDILGSEAALIAKEKGGIIKPHVPVIIGPTVPLEPIQTIAKENNSPLMQVKQNYISYEDENNAVAETALNTLASKIKIPPKAITQGLDMKQPCRFEVVEGSPLMIFDVAHNVQGISRLFESIKDRYPDASYRLLFGLSKNKDLKGCLELIVQQSSDYHLVEALNGRGAPCEQLAEMILQLPILAPNISIHRPIEDALRIAKEEARQKGQILVIFGTFFVMGDLRKAVGFNDPQDPSDLNERIHEKMLSG